jgi:hypothetical protein
MFFPYLKEVLLIEKDRRFEMANKIIIFGKAG